MLLIGLSTLDVFVHCAEFPGIDNHAYLPDYKMVPGGSAANMAFCLSCLGVPALLCTRVGRDPAGSLVRDYLRRRGVDTRLIAILFTYVPPRWGGRSVCVDPANL